MHPSSEMIESLNADFAKAEAVSFDVGPQGLIVATLAWGDSSARVALLGATVLSYVPAGVPETLFLSGKSEFLAGKPIRGGIPLCWPWFGAHPGDARLPRHGFFRLFEWKVAGTERDSRGSSMTLSLSASDESKKFWPYDFEALCRITLGRTLKVDVSVVNSGQSSFSLTCAFHPYFRFGDVRGVEIPVLAGMAYDDFLAPGSPSERKVDAAPFAISKEVDRAYAHDGAAVMEDRAGKRRIIVSGSSMESFVVWNPWEKKCAAIADLEKDDFLEFLCVEPGIIPPSARELRPGASFEAGIAIEVASLEE
ncbi:MAG: D-hexose-6-phosphate mutarotase [Spirochaetales bacterium]|jgi:glucose-6-phosphate 1-epimerase